MGNVMDKIRWVLEIETAPIMAKVKKAAAESNFNEEQLAAFTDKCINDALTFREIS